MENNLEQKVADTILNIHSDFLVIGEQQYSFGKPTPGTLIMVSALASTMPFINRESDNVLKEVLANAKDLSVIGKIVATLVLGSKRIREGRKVSVSSVIKAKRWSWKRFRFVMQDVTVQKEVVEVDYLAEEILHNVRPSELLKIAVERLGMSEIGDFFELTTSLSEANHLKRTKEVVIQSGE